MDLSLFDVPALSNDGMTLREQLRYTGNKWFALEKALEGESAELFLEYMEMTLVCEDDTDPRTFEYWDKLGMKKELHPGKHDGDHWASFVPKAAYLPENVGRKWPTVIFTNKIKIIHTEGCGIIQECAKRGYIAAVISPANDVDDSEYNASFLDLVLETLPSDPERMYATGFSYGSGRLEDLVLNHRYDAFAAYAPTGAHMMHNEYSVSDVQVERVRKAVMPTIIIDGMFETTQQFPFIRDTYEYHKPCELRHFTGVDANGNIVNTFPKTGPCKVQRLRRRLYMNRCRDVSYDQCVAAAGSCDPVSRVFAAPFDRTEVKKVYGVDCYLGDYIDGEGQWRLRLAGVDAMPHTITPPVGVLMLDFFDRFRRDLKTGRSIVVSE